MGHQHFGRIVANEVFAQSTKFLAHVEDPPIWASMSEPTRGRMTKNDVLAGRTLLAAAQAAMSSSAAHAGDTHAPTHAVDDAEHAALGWLHDQLAHVYGALHEKRADAELAAVRKTFDEREGHAHTAADVRAYVKLARKDDAVGKAVSATYVDMQTRDAILAAGEQLAAALDAGIAGPAAAAATKETATSEKERAVDALARWLYRWSLVAHRVVGHDGLVALGLATTRHHARAVAKGAAPEAAST